MKRFLIILLVILAAVSAVPTVNNLHAHRAERRLCTLPLPTDAQLTDSLSAAGKLTGNGNGMQYFAAILLRCDAAPEEIEAHYAALRTSNFEFLTAVQTGTKIRFAEHRDLHFDFAPDANGQYYIVYTWADSLPFFAEIDLRGH